ncbi:hypothetical protein A7U60_g5850 [Sanghuangporus baumii]|uniref:Uncharacterized protein n=1 Tax=Sanghuangporus baumii TaxID=108892 RepID=A0A9Q5HW54_SANBA|nr:hypothetical protein A7U60_g5850 [Sanghuangporus baumii]
MKGPSLLSLYPVVRSLKPAIDLGSHKDAMLNTFFAFHIIGSHVGLPMAFITMVILKTLARRHPTLISLLLSWIVYTTANLLLLYSGEARKTQPAFGVCLTQASMIYGSTVGVAAATLGLVLQLWLEFRGLKLMKDDRINRLSLLLLPWASFALITIGSAAYGAKHQSRVSIEWHFYCTIRSKAVVYTVSAFTLLFLALTLGFQAVILRTLLRASRHFRAVNQSSYHLVLRVGIFTIYSVITFVVSVVITLDPTTTFAYLFVSTLPLACFLIFGTQKENLRFWFRIPGKKKPDRHIPLAPMAFKPGTVEIQKDIATSESTVGLRDDKALPKPSASLCDADGTNDTAWSNICFKVNETSRRKLTEMRLPNLTEHRRTEDAGSSGCPPQAVGCNTNPEEHDLTPAQASSLSQSLAASSASAIATATVASSGVNAKHEGVDPQVVGGVIVIVFLVLALITAICYVAFGARGERCCSSSARLASTFLFAICLTSTIMEAAQPTESTPLIGHHGTTASTADPGPLPFIFELESDVYSDSDYPAVHRIIERKVDALEKSPSTVLTLKLLLCLRYLSGAYFRQGRDSWVDSRSAEQDVIDVAVRCWTDLQRIAWSQAALDEALWTEFPMENGKGAQVSLIEAILGDQANCLPSIKLDDRIALSLLQTWKNGRPRIVYDDRGSILRRTESFATPRVLHLIDLTTNLAYLLIFAHYLMRPMPLYPTDPPRLDYHFYCIAIYSACRILRDSWPSAMHGTFILTLVTLLSALPYMPRPRENSFNVLLFCFFMHIVQLLLPFSPSISLLAPRSVTFTVALMLQNLFAVVFIPALIFFVPIIFALLLILVASLNEIFMRVTGLATFDLFLFSVWCSGLLFTCLTAYMTLSTSSLPPAKFHHPDVPASWNSYGPDVGISLRRRFCRLITAHPRRYFFPVPLNLIPVVLVYLPRGILLLFRDKYLTARLKTTVEPAVWRIFVMPFTFIFGIVWLWK